MNKAASASALAQAVSPPLYLLSATRCRKFSTGFRWTSEPSALISIGNDSFSPTNCDALSVAGMLTSAGGTPEEISTPLQATGCASLQFKPTFAATTQGRVSKRSGASLHVHVASGEGQANIAKVKVDLPIQLPSRTSTLQKACVDSVFETNPAACSSESIVGHATAVTPLLKNPLTGPAYVVSHAGRSFPDLDIVLQGEGITLILTGNTDIKKGITSSTFNAVPDAPVSTSDLMLPEGPHSILAAFGSLCTGKLNMPTVITGQNGAVTKTDDQDRRHGRPEAKEGQGETRCEEEALAARTRRIDLLPQNWPASQYHWLGLGEQPTEVPHDDGRQRS